MKNQPKIDQLVQDDELIDLTRDLIRIPSHKETPGEEGEISEFLHEWFSDLGVEVELQEVETGRMNVIATLAGTEKGRGLMLNGHLDTVPPGESMENPYSPTLRDGKIYGRGAVDMKGGVAAMCLALKAAHETSQTLERDLIFAGVVGEESGSPGTEYILDHGPSAASAILGEPTSLEMVTAHKGIERLRIIVEGKAAHSSVPEEGINAITKASKIIQRIEDEIVPKLKRKENSLLGNPTLNIGYIKGGQERPNAVPSRCEIRIDRRWIPEESLSETLSELQNLVDDISEDDDDLSATVERDPTQGLIDSPHKPLSPPENFPLQDSLEQAHSEVLGRSPKITGATFWTDAAMLSNEADIPSLVYGPGSIKQAHSDNEYVPVDELKAAARVYFQTAMSICTQTN